MIDEPRPWHGRTSDRRSPDEAKRRAIVALISVPAIVLLAIAVAVILTFIDSL